MRALELRELIRKKPFEPLEIRLSDGRSVLVRHPDQVVVAERHAILGLAQVKEGRRRFKTPDDPDAIAKDWLLLDLVHIVSVEPANGNAGGRRGSPKRRRGGGGR